MIGVTGGLTPSQHAVIAAALATCFPTPLCSAPPSRPEPASQLPVPWLSLGRGEPGDRPPGRRCDDRGVITLDDVDTLLFDVLGTVVDEGGSMRAEVAAALDQAGAVGSAEVLATAWARRFQALVSSINQGAPWRSTDDLNAEALADVLRDGPSLPAAAVRQLALAGHRRGPGLTRKLRCAASLTASPSWRCRTATCRC
jgi:hypothetical protein